jgi:hypothetical protein
MTWRTSLIVKFRTIFETVGAATISGIYVNGLRKSSKYVGPDSLLRSPTSKHIGPDSNLRSPTQQVY